MQLDIFADSHDVELRNRLVDALAADDAAASLAAAVALAEDFPDDWALRPAESLMAALEAEAGRAPCADAAACAGLAAHLRGPLASDARRLLGADAAGAWLRRRWASLARAAGAVPWVAEAPDGHAAALWLQAGDWPAAAAAVEGIASWRRIPQPLAWMTEARLHAPGLPDAWPLVVELAWLAPARAETLLKPHADAALQRLLRRFDTGFDPGDDAGWAWFPAWLLVEQPQLAGATGTARTGQQTAPERAFRLLQSLLRLERQGAHRELVELRRDLKGTSEALFACYMRTR